MGGPINGKGRPDAVVIVESGGVSVGKTVDALLCDTTITGSPNLRTAVLVHMTLVHENRTPRIEPGNDVRDIVLVTGVNGVTTFAVSPGRRATPERLRRARLAQA
jgi:hypothetical protein